MNTASTDLSHRRIILAVAATALSVVALQHAHDTAFAKASPNRNSDREITAEKVVIVDKNGKKRMELGMNGNVPGISIFDDETIAGVRIGISRTSGSREGQTFPKPYLSLLNKDGEDDVELLTQFNPERQHSATSFRLTSSSQKGRISMGVAANGESGLTLASGGADSSLVLEVRPNAGPFIFGHDDNGKLRLAMGVNHKMGRYVLELNDEKGKPVWRAYENKPQEKVAP